MGQIISLLTQFQVTTIFAVAEDVLPTYQVILHIWPYINYNKPRYKCTLEQFVNFCAVFQTHLCLGMCPEYHTFFDATALHMGIRSEAVLQPVLPQLAAPELN